MTQPLLEVLADAGALASRAADLMLTAARAKNGAFSAALSGGSTPKRLYPLLATMPFPWARTHWFWGDERFVLPDRLGGRTPLPVEIVAYGWRSTLDRLERAGFHPALRGGTGHPFMTDGGSHIADCAIAGIDDPAGLERQLSGLVGVIEAGLFIGLASRVIVASARGVEVIEQ